MGVERSAESGAGEPLRKRARLAPAGGAEGEELRARLERHAQAKLDALSDRMSEQLRELYFLRAGGNMTEYLAWRRRPAQPALQAFLSARAPRASVPAAAAAPVSVPAAPVSVSLPEEAAAAAVREARVAARVAELARAGLWPERRLPRVLEPPRTKTHWDYVLEEMAWLAADAHHERKWKKQAAKKCARAVQKYFQDKAQAAQKAEKAQEIHLKKLAAFASREIRTFWANVEKVVEWKRARRVERARKEALEEQLSYMVDRSEQYSRQLAAGLLATAPTPPSDEEFRAASGAGGDKRAASDYAASDSDSADDEETIAEQEQAERPQDVADELSALRDEAELDLAALLRKYSALPPQPPDDETRSHSSDSEGGASSDSERLSALVGEPEEEVEALAAAAARLQPTGTTLAATSVATPVPALLRHSLREYQHVGLHWLATMHARRLNGILADEMGLGKTIQTIALLAHLALEGGDWGPHLVVAPTSVVLNWEMEFKKWCPAFKILTYYGTIKERKLKRVGWTKPNSFHVCITSYKLVVQDHQSFRRKRWKYLILDEAQNIKNFKSQRWQVLLNFQTERRLLLTGTPLQNSVVELWSLMHFLMPAVFASHSEFREWFTPLAALAAAGGEGEAGAGGEGEAGSALVRRLHGVLRPFLLRRLKADVERQMPRKHEHVLLCRLARRQQALYDDFMSRAKTRESLQSGSLLSVINVLMQLRKVCNHPDLFEPRPATSPFRGDALTLQLPRLVLGCVAVAVAGAGGAPGLAALEASGALALVAHRARHLAPPRRLLDAPPPRAAPPPPACRLRLHVRLVARAPPRSLLAPAPPLRLAAAASSTDTDTKQKLKLETGNEVETICPSAARLLARRRSNMRRLALNNERRAWRLPLYGADLRASLFATPPPPPACLAPPSLAERVAGSAPLLERFALCWERARAPPPRLPPAAPPLPAPPPALAELHSALHVAALRQSVAFPHPSLLQYDCGKLQTLDALMRRLKAGGHRVLVFTQMTRMLDVLERFMSLHGHAYLRLDGATKVERRQQLVDRFNSERRIFALILSTRAGGVGLNLTGADTVVFYDSDWNPTMDAQAQDRCHRIGQTRDVHVYRLVTRRTVEENILRKAQQKRALSDLAIEHGRFTAANLADIIGVGEAAARDEAAPADFESALAAAEDEADAAAAAAARAEAAENDDEFDESQRAAPPPPAAEAAPAPAPLGAGPHDEPEDPDEAEFAALMKQLSGVERFAMRVVERGGAEAERAELEAVRARLREWEAARRDLRCRQPPASPAPRAASPSPPLTYPRAAAAQVWESSAALGPELMPVWSPPTPPWGAGDLYVESWSRALYRTGAAADTPTAPRAPRRAAPTVPAARAPAAPQGLFARHPRRHAHAPAPPAAPHAPHPDWSGAEDAALRRALRLQRLPPDPPPACTPNWDWCAELVGELRRAHRTPRAARERHERLADGARRRAARRPPRRRDDEAPRPPLSRLDAMREAGERRRAAPRRRYEEPRHNSERHAALLGEHGLDYENPPEPMEVAERRADRIAKEKLKQGAGAPGPAPPAAPPQPPAPAPAPGAPRLVVAGAGGGGARRDAALQLYRQQALARQHLKILHHPAQGGGVGVTSVVSGAAGGVSAGAPLHVQQLALRRARPPDAPPAPPAHSAPAPPAAPARPHLLLAHIGPRAAPPPAPPD